MSQIVFSCKLAETARKLVVYAVETEEIGICKEGALLFLKRADAYIEQPDIGNFQNLLDDFRKLTSACNNDS